ncbi:hypothetical protein [Ralstonia pickettii]|uniref:hypothetical protein n=1 Tax=Ralstonia pickettii TaxID=329 RepID=UPI000818997D|nr:hypothetical protein [Ralstonia pickettii]OCS43689.1 hypothetical protein BEK67_01035 [Ralstonia pickettii]
MSYLATVYKVMIASPSDVKEERQIVREEIANWNAAHSEARGIALLPASWDANSAPSTGDRPQGIINKQILKGADLLVGVFWTRLGTSTGKFPSGTVEEIEEHIASDKPAMLYFSQAPIVPGNLDQDQYNGVLRLRDSLKNRALYHTYEELSQFRANFTHHLQITMNSEGFGRPIEATVEELRDTLRGLGEKAKALLLLAASSTAGAVLHRTSLNGTLLSAGDKNVAEGASAREIAAWNAGLKELETEGLVEPNPARSVFRLTHAGYELAETLTSTG